ncbi:DUF790 family protein [Chloroflexi bacterium TSY]|nr:DUF790 family protein [Chloroflexi bacterium TSY]
MLTGDLVRPRLLSRNGTLHIQMLSADNIQWQRTASDLITLFQQHQGQQRSQWQRALELYEGNRIDYIVIRGLAKVLTDAALFSPLETRVPPPELRRLIFERGPVYMTRDLMNQQTREDMLDEAASIVGLDRNGAETAFYSDRPAEHLLTDPGPEWTPESLIARYNLELSRAALYWSDQMRVQVYDSYKDLWKYIKLFKLMFWATPLDDGYRVELDGPISPFVHRTTRYGRQFAAFLPALLLCQRWSMEATVYLPVQNGPLTYCLDHTTQLTTHFRGSGEFDSQLESDFAAEFEAKFGNERGKWRLTREDEVLLLGDTVMIPDFTVTNKKDGRRAIIEIMGFWHPNYLERKVAKVRAAERSDLILLVYEGVNLAKEKLQDVPSEVLYFKNKPVLKDVMEAIERVAKHATD